MYLTPTDLHTMHVNAIENSCQLAQDWIDFLGDSVRIGARFNRRVLEESSRQTERTALPEVTDVGTPANAMRVAIHNARPLLGEHLPGLVAATVHATAAQAERICRLAEKQLTYTGQLTDRYFDRSLKYAPWETFRAIKTTRNLIGESLTAAARIAESAIAAAEAVDAEVRREIQPVDDMPAQSSAMPRQRNPETSQAVG